MNTSASQVVGIIILIISFLPQIYNNNRVNIDPALDARGNLIIGTPDNNLPFTNSALPFTVWVDD